eukprot:NODE_3849_length_723_cov_20.857567_g1242_i1.p2 GENE.NODE_3849_length_723_cov_20.857567_g1242_i1~~NODE_3849_length_723_cov_20.857567_g1242_i1.p2  ORF type:complete len:77 (+),score=12.49 NODE_3849_length_723_cov_20.857567_g1242_i1:138-368(+)
MQLLPVPREPCKNTAFQLGDVQVGLLVGVRGLCPAPLPRKLLRLRSIGDAVEAAEKLFRGVRCGCQSGLAGHRRRE